MIGVVTDSAAALDPNGGAVGGVGVVAMQLDVEGRSQPDSDFSVEEIIGADRPVRTAAPSPGRYLEAVANADRGDGVVVLTVSGRMSSSHQSAVLAARMYDGPVEVLDTGTAAGAQALIVEAAAAEAAGGGSLEAVRRRAELVSDRVRLVAGIGDLRPLARTGRLPRLIAGITSSAGLRPVIEFRRGSLRVLRPQLSAGAAGQAIVAAWRASREPRARLHLSAMYATRREDAEQLLDAVAAEVTPWRAFIAPFGPVMVAHTGPDVAGLAWWWER